MKEIKLVDDCKKHNFLKSAKNHYLAASEYILEKTPISSSIVKSLKCIMYNNIDNCRGSEKAYH